jgi:hypothetical protein
MQLINGFGMETMARCSDAPAGRECSRVQLMWQHSKAALGGLQAGGSLLTGGIVMQ